MSSCKINLDFEKLDNGNIKVILEIAERGYPIKTQIRFTEREFSISSPNMGREAIIEMLTKKILEAQ
jgi:hypothetical protein